MSSGAFFVFAILFSISIQRVSQAMMQCGFYPLLSHTGIDWYGAVVQATNIRHRFTVLVMTFRVTAVVWVRTSHLLYSWLGDSFAGLLGTCALFFFTLRKKVGWLGLISRSALRVRDILHQFFAA